MRLPDIRQNKGGTADTPPFAFPQRDWQRAFYFSGMQDPDAMDCAPPAQSQKPSTKKENKP